MDILSIIILGLVQGITEWIPVSSKTQDTFVYLKFLHGNPASVLPILLYLHIGTVLGAIIYFRREIAALFASYMRKPLDIRAHANGEIGFIVAALIGTGIVGLPLLLIEKEFLPTLNGGWLFAIMGAGLLVTGFLLLKQKGANKRIRESATWLDGIIIGLFQGLSILPGVSRDGTSTAGLVWRGFDSESSFHLSFLLSIPTVICAELIFYLAGVMTFPLTDGILLAASSLVFGYFAMDIVLRLVKKVNIAYVVFALGLLMIAAGLLGGS
jgi:undecaprenyl-diphosphatase